MSEQPPWWYSGSSTPPGPESSDSPPTAPPLSAPSSGGAPSLSDLMSMASTVVEWATDRVMAPHADHRDPAEHPQCLICRASALLSASTSSPRVPGQEPARIMWIDIDDEPDDPNIAAA